MGTRSSEVDVQDRICIRVAGFYGQSSNARRLCVGGRLFFFVRSLRTMDVYIAGTVSARGHQEYADDHIKIPPLLTSLLAKLEPPSIFSQMQIIVFSSPKQEHLP